MRPNMAALGFEPGPKAQKLRVIQLSYSPMSSATKVNYELKTQLKFTYLGIQRDLANQEHQFLRDRQQVQKVLKVLLLPVHRVDLLIQFGLVFQGRPVLQVALMVQKVLLDR